MNTTFRDGIEDTFAVGNHLSAQGHYPLYVAWEDYSAGMGNNIMSASYDQGLTWSTPMQVNDNASPVDEFQPNLTVAADGKASVAFNSLEAAVAGLALDHNVRWGPSGRPRTLSKPFPFLCVTKHEGLLTTLREKHCQEKVPGRSLG